jgi:hypothetical protein
MLNAIQHESPRATKGYGLAVDAVVPDGVDRVVSQFAAGAGCKLK